MSRTDDAAAYFAGRCRNLLRERATDDSLTVETRVFDSGDFEVTAFHTTHRFDDGRFVREFVEYSTFEQSDSMHDEFSFGVQDYYTGHHEQFIEHVLEEIAE